VYNRRSANDSSRPINDSQDNQKLIELLNTCFASAEQENKQGIMDFLATRLDAHEKHGWMLRSTLKKDRA
jgi:DNA-binding ferritin-like protein